MVLAGGLASCSGTPEDFDPLDPADPVPDCEVVTVEPGSPLVSVTAEAVAGVPTVVQVTFETSAPADGTVEFGSSHLLGQSTGRISTSETDHSALLVGVPAGTAYYRIHAQMDGVDHCSDIREAQTAPLPLDLPELTLADLPGSSSGGYTVTPIRGLGHSWVVILDSAGRYVWVYQAEEPIWGAALSLDRRAVLMNTWPGSADNDGEVFRVALDGTLDHTFAAPGIHTDFVELEDGTIATLGWVIREFEDGQRRLLGDTIVELSTDGEVRTVWDIFDHIEPDLDQTYPMGWLPQDPELEDWSHVNFISHDPDRDQYLVTVGYLDQVVAVDRTSGDVAWILGGAESTFEVTSEPPLMGTPHSVYRRGDELLLFNRCLYECPCSETLWIDLDIDAGTAAETWSYESEACLTAYILGNAELLSDGSVMTVWSTAGQIDEVTASGELVWRVNADLGAGFGFARRVDSLY
jgi:hypothetical protein